MRSHKENKLQDRNIKTNTLEKKHIGKVAIVTGSTRGIGLAISKRLCQEGAKVIISSRKKENVDRALKECHEEGFDDVTGMVCHVGNAEHRKALVEKAISDHGRIDILVNNAACNPAYDLTLMETTDECFDKMMDVNVKAGFMMTKEVYPHMKKAGGGYIVFISSVCGLIPDEWPGIYAVTKTAVLGLTKALSHQLVEDNIRVNGIACGVFKTKFAEVITENKRLKKHTLKRIGQKRFAEPSECAGVVSFLCSDDASYINGETLVVAGGGFTRL